MLSHSACCLSQSYLLLSSAYGLMTGADVAAELMKGERCKVQAALFL
jgi:hypothetical protein